MADTDYSTTPLWKKLGIKAGGSFAIVNAPDGFGMTLPAVRMRKGSPLKTTEVILVFATRLAALQKTFRALKPTLAAHGGLWVGYPKRSSSIATNLTFESVQKVGLDAGLVDNKSCAIDDDWSGVRFVYRLKDRGRSPTR